MAVLLVILIVSVSVNSEPTPIQIEDVLLPIPEGFEVIGPEDMRIQRGQWKINIIIKDDNFADIRYFEAELRSMAVHIQDRLLNTLPSCLSTDMNQNECLEEFSHRTLRASLALLKEPAERMVTFDSPLTRKRRGLVDIIGKASRYLFGTATIQDVQKVESLVVRARQENRKVLHVVKDLATVIDHAIEEHQQDHQRIRTMWNALVNLRNISHWTFSRLHILERRSAIEEAIQYLITIKNELNRIKFEHQQILQDLQTCRITNNILPTRLYNQISEKITNLGYIPLDYAWIIEHSNVDFYVPDLWTTRICSYRSLC